MYNMTVVMRMQTPAMSISPLQLVGKILGPEFKRVEDEDGKPVFQKDFIKIKILVVDQD